MKKIRILQVIGSLRIGGAENVAMNIGRYIDKKKFQCDYLVFGDTVGEYEQEAIQLGSKVIHIAAPNAGYKAYYENVKRTLRQGDYCIVHSHVLLNNGIVLKAAHDVGINVRIAHSHSTDSGRKENLKYRIYSMVMKKLIRKYSTDYVACGVDAGSYLFGKELFNKKGVIINNGIDTRKFKYVKEKRKKMSKEFGIENEVVIGHVGRLAEVKNHKFLLDVYQEYKKSVPNSKLLFVGDGEVRKSIEEKIMTLGLQEDVIITGMRSDVSDIMQVIDVFVFPSLYEGLPLTLVEAQSSGLNCLVSSNVTREIQVTDLVTFLSLNNSPAVWAEKLIEVTKYSRIDQSEEIKRKGYDISTTIRELETLYEK